MKFNLMAFRVGFLQAAIRDLRDSPLEMRYFLEVAEREGVAPSKPWEDEGEENPELFICNLERQTAIEAMQTGSDYYYINKDTVKDFLEEVYIDPYRQEFAEAFYQTASAAGLDINDQDTPAPWGAPWIWNNSEEWLPEGNETATETAVRFFRQYQKQICGQLEKEKQIKAQYQED